MSLFKHLLANVLIPKALKTTLTLTYKYLACTVIKVAMMLVA